MNAPCPPCDRLSTPNSCIESSLSRTLRAVSSHSTKIAADQPICADCGSSHLLPNDRGTLTCAACGLVTEEIQYQTNHFPRTLTEAGIQHAVQRPHSPSTMIGYFRELGNPTWKRLARTDHCEGHFQHTLDKKFLEAIHGSLDVPIAADKVLTTYDRMVKTRELGIKAPEKRAVALVVTYRAHAITFDLTAILAICGSTGHGFRRALERYQRADPVGFRPPASRTPAVLRILYAHTADLGTLPSQLRLAVRLIRQFPYRLGARSQVIAATALYCAGRMLNLHPNRKLIAAAYDVNISSLTGNYRKIAPSLQVIPLVLGRVSAPPMEAIPSMEPAPVVWNNTESSPISMVSSVVSVPTYTLTVASSPTAPRTRSSITIHHMPVLVPRSSGSQTDPIIRLVPVGVRYAVILATTPRRRMWLRKGSRPVRLKFGERDRSPPLRAGARVIDAPIARAAWWTEPTENRIMDNDLRDVFADLARNFPQPASTGGI